MPKFDDKGLLTAVVVHHETQPVLMVGFMDQVALDATRETGLAHFHSRSRGKLWQKGETSGHVLRVQSDLCRLRSGRAGPACIPAGPTCHTGVPSCFYRVLEDGASPTRQVLTLT